MKNIILFTALFITINFPLHSQVKESVDIYHKLDKLTLNLGMGLDMGGIGVNINYYPQKNIGVFAGLGYAFVGMGYNSGIKLRLISGETLSKVAPFLIGMYGYHSVIKIENAEQLNKTFYGPTLGVGIDTKARKEIYWSFSINRPLKANEVDDYIRELKKIGVQFKNELPPVRISISLRAIMS